MENPNENTFDNVCSLSNFLCEDEEQDITNDLFNVLSQNEKSPDNNFQKLIPTNDLASQILASPQKSSGNNTSAIIASTHKSIIQNKKNLEDCCKDDQQTSFESQKPKISDHQKDKINQSLINDSHMSTSSNKTHSYLIQNNSNKEINEIQDGLHEEIKVMVIGATGAGKSSLINLFYVWSQEWQPDDLADCKNKVIIKTKYLDGDSEAEKNAQNTAESQTIKAKLYTFELKNKQTGISYSLNFLDTPGIGDTEGIEKDEQHFDIIMDTVTKTDGLNAILLVMNGADARINMRIKYIMVRLQSMIPDALRDNLMVLLTNVDLCPNLDINQVLDYPIDQNKIFYYNNQIFQVDPSQLSNHNILRKVGQSFQNSIDTLSAMLDEIGKCSVKPTYEFAKIKESRDKLKKMIVECNDTAAKICKKKQELQKFSADITSGQIQLSELQEQINQTVIEESFESIDTPYHNTTCMTCKNCCHEKCRLDETKQEGSSYFMKCWAFSGFGQNCGQCSHSYTSHVHLRVKYVKKTSEVPKINSSVQDAIQSAKNDHDVKIKARDAIDAEIQKLDYQQQQKHNEIKKIVLGMRKVCSRFDYMKEIEACINVLSEQIDQASGDFANSLDQNTAQKLDALQKTKAKMEKLKSDLILYLQNSSRD